MNPEPSHVTTDKTERVIRLDEQVKSMDEKLDKVIAMLEGNGRPGVMVRVDRLEQLADGQRWLSRAFIGAVVVLIVGFAWQLITNGTPQRQGELHDGTTESRTGTR